LNAGLLKNLTDIVRAARVGARFGAEGRLAAPSVYRTKPDVFYYLTFSNSSARLTPSPRASLAAAFTEGFRSPVSMAAM
jgi:hypothetical protein